MLAHERRRRRWRRLALIPLVPLLAFAGFYAFDWYQGQRAWREACAEADRLDLGWRWEDLLARRPELPPDRDAIRVTYTAAAKLPPKWPNWATVIRDEDLPPQRPVAPVDLDLPLVVPQAETIEDRRQSAAVGFELDLDDLSPNQRPAARQVRTLRTALSAADEAWQVAVGLADLSAGRPESGQQPVLLQPPSDSNVKFRLVAKVLRLHATIADEEGRPDDALHDSRATLGIARAAAEPPSTFTALTATAMRQTAATIIERTLAQGEPSAAALVAAQRDVHGAVESSLWLEAWRGERAMFEDFIRAVDESRVTRANADEVFLSLDKMFPPDVNAITGWPAIDEWLDRTSNRGYRKANMALNLRCITALVELLKESPDAAVRQPERFAAIRDRVAPGIEKLRVADQILFETDRRQRALLASVAAALAAERLRRDAGRWPNSLAELAPGYLKTVPSDPFDLRPLRYKRLPDGVVIYAVGPDGVDDGGVIHRSADILFPPDIGVRLWDVAHRRQPPKPADDGMKKP